MSELANQVARWKELKKKLAKVETLVKELRDLEEDLGADRLEILELTLVKPSKNGATKHDADPDPALWGKLKKLFKDGKATLPAPDRKELAAKNATTTAVLEATLAEYTQGSFRGPKSGVFIVK